MLKSEELIKTKNLIIFYNNAINAKKIFKIRMHRLFDKNLHQK